MKSPIFVTLFYCVSCWGQTAPPTFCALHLTVKSADGLPASGATAYLVDPLERVVARENINSGRGSFCDLGFGPHSIRIFQDGSATVTVSGIRSFYGESQDLTVILNRLPAEPEGGAGNACNAYLRISSNGVGVPGADIYSAGKRMATSDDYGRVLLLLPVKQFAVFEIRKFGYRVSELPLACSTWSESLERSVVLTPSGK